MVISIGKRSAGRKAFGQIFDTGHDCEYSIIWDPKLFPSCKLENQKPMDFDTPIAARVSQVCVRHLQSFFVKAIINDNLGIIANAHMARADASDKNAFDGDCLELARRHSIAVGKFPR